MKKDWDWPVIVFLTLVGVLGLVVLWGEWMLGL